MGNVGTLKRWNVETLRIGDETKEFNAETLRTPRPGRGRRRIRGEERAESGIWLTITTNVTIRVLYLSRKTCKAFGTRRLESVEGMGEKVTEGKRGNQKLEGGN
jgi:hypothetical protein